MRAFLALTVLATALTTTVFAAPPGAIIANTATLEYQSLVNQPVTQNSNTVEATVGVLRSPAALTLTRVVTGGGTWQESVGPSSCFQGGAYVNLADPVLVGGSTIDPTDVQEVSATSSYNLGEPVFIRLEDSDQNLDYQVLDTAVVTVTDAVTGDSETIQLTETGLDTGVFAGYVPTAGGTPTAGDCVLQSASRSSLTVDYVDPIDAADTAQSSALFDPVQRVFESRTGTAISGATIEIVDAATGLPAVVYGNDGVSQFPSAIVSGSTAVDSSGTSYVFGPGEYRFPVVPDGDYRLIVTAPPEYVAPSSADPTDLQNLPGAPYAIGSASFGTTFTKLGDISIAFDIPVDPLATSLFLQKRTLTTTAAPGDFVRYELQLENASPSGVANNIRMMDTLPPGVRFVPGSVTVNGTSAADPIISSDARTLEFSVTRLDASENASVFYVVEVIGGKNNQNLVNSATAFAAGGLVSNEATATIKLTEDLFRSTGTIVGRVLEGDCSQDTFAEEQGVENIRIYLEDGRYAVTDAGGRFHFEGLRAGTHVAQLDTFSVPNYFDVIGCSDTPGYAGRADSQFVKMTPGSLLRADFYLRRKPAPEGRINIEMQSSGTDSAEQVAYEMTVNGIGNVAIENIDLVVSLPDGVTYKRGTMTLDSVHEGDPHANDQGLSLALPDRTGNWTTKIEFLATIASSASGELSTKAVAKFDSPIEAGQTTPPAETKMVRDPSVFANAGYVLNLKFAVLSDELSVEDRLTLDALIRDWQGVQDVQVSVVGHSDSQRISARNQHLFADNYVLSRARANSTATYVATALELGVESLQVTGRGPDEPVASNESADGRQKNRRVEMVLSGVRPSKPSFLEVTQASSGKQVAETKGAVPGTEKHRNASPAEPSRSALERTIPIETLKPGVSMLLPKRGFQPSIPSTKISIKHKPTQTVEVWINDNPVSALNFEATEHSVDGKVAVSRWKGVALDDGLNKIRAVVSDADGTKAKTLKRSINFSGVPVRGEVLAERSVLIADGKTKPVIAVRLFDRKGKQSREGMVGRYRVDAPFRSWWDVENDRKNDIVQIGSREPTYRIGEDGIALIELEPTTQTGEVTVNLNFENFREQELRVWMKPAARDWILVGFAEGTSGYNTLSKNTSAAIEAGNQDDYYDEGRVAFFAKGQIKGEYLLTLAYDSDREREDTRDAFNTVIDPNRYYPLYADGAEQRFEAPSQRKLYVKLERNQFFALFGDFDTALSVTNLARYERRFNGLKSEFRGKNSGYSVFAADTNQSFNRDEIRGDGTSGLYRLSNAPIIANSEQVRIEVRDRFDTGQVLESTTMTRFLDYNLDTLSGTLFFKKPVQSRDLNFNPIFIVVEYESASTGTEDVVAGGRGSVWTASDKVELGVTHINDQSTGSESDLTGADFRWQINNQTELKAEVAETNSTVAGVKQSGTGHSVELEHNGEKVDVRAYMGEIDDAFGLGSQSAAEQGLRRLGVDVRAKINERVSLEGEAGWQQGLATRDIRNLARAQLRYERKSFSGTLGLTHAEDKFDDGDTRTSDLAELGVSKRVLDGKVTLRAGGSTALNNDAESADFPTQLLLGADYRILSNVDLVAEYEKSDGRDIDATMTRLGVRATPWSRAQIDTSVTNEVSEFGPRLFANVGLVQGFQLNERWSFDVGVDQSNTLSGTNLRQFDPDRELGSGSLNDDFLAVFTGATYNAELWTANSRAEYRNSDSEERTSLLFGWYREPLSGHGLSASLTLFQADMATGNEMTTSDFKFGWAYRMADRKWSFLNRTDLVLDDLKSGESTQKSWRVINNFNANRRYSAAIQLALQYAFKYVRNDFDGSSYNGYTDLIGADMRRGIRGRWDAGVNTSIYHSYKSSVVDYGLGFDVGYNLATNIWLTLGYNVIGFHDSDFTQARYTAQGPYIRFSIKADQQTLKDIAGQR